MIYGDALFLQLMELGTQKISDLISHQEGTSIMLSVTLHITKCVISSFVHIFRINKSSSTLKSGDKLNDVSGLEND